LLIIQWCLSQIRQGGEQGDAFDFDRPAVAVAGATSARCGRGGRRPVAAAVDMVLTRSVILRHVERMAGYDGIDYRR
jgi:hypothetical protein